MDRRDFIKTGASLSLIPFIGSTSVQPIGSIKNNDLYPFNIVIKAFHDLTAGTAVKTMNLNIFDYKVVSSATHRYVELNVPYCDDPPKEEVRTSDANDLIRMLKNECFRKFELGSSPKIQITQKTKKPNGNYTNLDFDGYLNNFMYPNKYAGLDNVKIRIIFRNEAIVRRFSLRGCRSIDVLGVRYDSEIGAVTFTFADERSKSGYYGGPEDILGVSTSNEPFDLFFYEFFKGNQSFYSLMLSDMWIKSAFWVGDNGTVDVTFFPKDPEGSFTGWSKSKFVEGRE